MQNEVTILLKKIDLDYEMILTTSCHPVPLFFKIFFFGNQMQFLIKQLKRTVFPIVSCVTMVSDVLTVEKSLFTVPMIRNWMFFYTLLENFFFFSTET